MLARQTLDIDLGTYEYKITECVERGSLDMPLTDTKAMSERVKKILGHKDADIVRVRVAVPDCLTPAGHMHLGAILAVLDAWGIDRELVYG